MNQTYKKLRNWLGLSIATFLILTLVHLALPAVFLALQVPSFTFGFSDFWLLRWQNDTNGSGIEFNLIFLLTIAIIVGLVMTLMRTRWR